MFLIDEIDQLLKINAGHSPRLQKIRRDILAQRVIWPADEIYVKQLANHYLNKKYNFEKTYFENQKTAPDDNTKTSELSSDSNIIRNNYSQGKSEKVIPFGTGLVLAAFFVFVIFSPLDDQTTRELSTSISPSQNSDPYPIPDFGFSGSSSNNQGANLGGQGSPLEFSSGTMVTSSSTS